MERFSLPSNSPAGSAGNTWLPTSVAVGDFNSDGIPDLVIAASSLTGGHESVMVLLGNGQGGFSAAGDPAPPNGPVAIATGDFNGDGNLDAAVVYYAANNYQTGLNLFFGLGDGTLYSPGLVDQYAPNPAATFRLRWWRATSIATAGLISPS